MLRLGEIDILDDRIVHVIPSDKDHSYHNCWCEPEVEPVEGYDGNYGAVIIHKELQ